MVVDANVIVVFYEKRSLGLASLWSGMSLLAPKVYDRQEMVRFAFGPGVTEANAIAFVNAILRRANGQEKTVSAQRAAAAGEVHLSMPSYPPAAPAVVQNGSINT